MSSPPRPAGTLELVVHTGASVEVHPLPLHGAVRLGREEGNDIRIDSPSVSRRHAILHLGPPLSIEDLGSRSGTLVDAAPGQSGEHTSEPRRLTRQVAAVAVGAPINLGSVLVVVRRPASDRAAPDPAAGPQGVRDAAMRELYALAARAAEGRLPVLILGENGVGKEVLADFIHARSRRAGKPFVKLNCAAIPVGLVEGELFGTEKGAFNDAPQRPGLLETAHGGSLFLDEVGELPPAVQAKLLRVLEDGTVTRLGGRSPRPLDVRFVAATNRDLAAAVRAGSFREDLLFRLNAMTLTIPPLRERVAEIAPLAAIFAQRACDQLERERAPAISPEALAILERHGWPGNVRELRNVMDRAVLLAGHAPQLSPEHLPPELVRSAAGARAPQGAGGRARTTVEEIAPAGVDPLDELAAKKSEIERQRLVHALERCGYNQTKAAELLGIARRTMVYKMKEHGIRGPRG